MTPGRVLKHPDDWTEFDHREAVNELRSKWADVYFSNFPKRTIPETASRDDLMAFSCGEGPAFADRRWCGDPFVHFFCDNGFSMIPLFIKVRCTNTEFRARKRALFAVALSVARRRDDYRP